MEKLYKEFLKEDSNGKKIYGINSYAIIFIMYTGLRISECISLKWEDINEELNIITISHSIIVLKDRDRKDGKTKYITKDTKDAKTKSSNRSIPLSERAKEILNELKKINSICDKKDYIFINKNGNLMNKRNVLRTLNKMQKNAKCEVEKCGLHALRHSFGSYLILHGTDIKTVSELLGHADIQITLNIYIHIINMQKASAISLFDTIKNNTVTNLEETGKSVLEELKNNKIDIIEIEDGMLGYVNEGKIIKLPINKSFELDNIKINNKDIYNEFYSC